jgi:hypothetical protein
MAFSKKEHLRHNIEALRIAFRPEQEQTPSYRNRTKANDAL